MSNRYNNAKYMTIAETIIHKLQAGEFQALDHFFSRDELAQAYNISPGTARAVLRLFHFSESVSCALESYWEGERNLFGRFGTRYDIGKFQLRCGAMGPPITPTFGCGFLGKNFRLDLSARWIRNLGYALDCGIGYTFNKKESEVLPISE